MLMKDDKNGNGNGHADLNAMIDHCRHCLRTGEAGGKVPEAIRDATIGNFLSSDMVVELARGHTLTEMLNIFNASAARSETAFREMYKGRESSYPADIAERENVIGEIHRDRGAARNCLHQIIKEMADGGHITPRQKLMAELALASRQKTNGSNGRQK